MLWYSHPLLLFRLNFSVSKVGIEASLFRDNCLHTFASTTDEQPRLGVLLVIESSFLSSK